jgi:hypothetical protein
MATFAPHESNKGIFLFLFLLLYREAGKLLLK